MHITENMIIKQKEGFVTSDMNQEKVMLNIEKGKYYNLGIVGGRIWSLIESPGRSIHNIVIELQKEYNVSKEQCQREVLNFVSKLYSEGIIEVREK